MAFRPVIIVASPNGRIGLCSLLRPGGRPGAQEVVMRRVLFPVFCTILTVTPLAASGPLWRAATDVASRTASVRLPADVRYAVFAVDRQQLAALLGPAPSGSATKPVVIDLPLPDGRLAAF